MEVVRYPETFYSTWCNNAEYCQKQLQFTLAKAMKAEREGGVQIYLYSYFKLGARCGGWLTPRPGRFTPGNGPLHFV